MAVLQNLIAMLGRKKKHGWNHPSKILLPQCGADLAISAFFAGPLNFEFKWMQNV